jgi:hypothetical protein
MTSFSPTYVQYPFRLDYSCLRVVHQRQLCDLELIINGGFSPLEGFMNQADYDRSVVPKNVVGTLDQTKLSAAWSIISGWQTERFSRCL